MEQNFGGVNPRSADELGELIFAQIFASLSWEDCLSVITVLPTLICSMLRFEPVTIAQQEKYAELVWYYATLAKWLGQLARPGKSPDPELETGKNSEMRSRVILSKAVLDLSKQLFLRIPEIKTKTCPTPAAFWLKYELQTLKGLLLDSGLITGEPSTPESKELVEKNCRRVACLLKFEDRETIPPASVVVDTAGENLDNFHALIVFAYREGANDIRFRNSKEYVGFYKAILAWGRDCRRNSDFQLIRIENGEDAPGGRAAPRPRSK